MSFVRDAAGRLRGAMPLYAKTHSRVNCLRPLGRSLSNAREAHIIQTAECRAVHACDRPAAPAAPGPDSAHSIEATLAQRCAPAGAPKPAFVAPHQFCRARRVRSALPAPGCSHGPTSSLHWLNNGYESLSTPSCGLCRPPSGKNFAQERAKAIGGRLNSSTSPATQSRKRTSTAFSNSTWIPAAGNGGSPYLTRETFSLRYAETHGGRHAVRLYMEDGEAIAGAMNMIGSDTLYGRYWGTCWSTGRCWHFRDLLLPGLRRLCGSRGGLRVASRGRARRAAQAGA